MGLADRDYMQVDNPARLSAPRASVRRKGVDDAAPQSVIVLIALLLWLGLVSAIGYGIVLLVRWMW